MEAGFETDRLRLLLDRFGDVADPGTPQQSGSSSGAVAPTGSAYDRSGGRMGNRTDIDNTTPDNTRATPRR